jgi:catechol-2,3-dioxygenase
VNRPGFSADPDGNGIEVYADASDAWRREPQRVAQAKPLDI